MRRSDFSRPVIGTCLRVLCGGSAALLTAATVAAQSAAPGDRYAAAAPAAGAQDVLIDWRRDEAPADAGTAAATRLASPDAATAADDSNPLRRAAEPPPAVAGDATPMIEPPVSSATAMPAYGTPPAAEPSAAAPNAPAPTAPAPEFNPPPFAAPPAATPDTTAFATPPASDPAPAAAAPPAMEPFARYDAAVAPALHEASSGTTSSSSSAAAILAGVDDSAGRRLAPPSGISAADTPGTKAAAAALPFDFSQFESLSTAGIGLAVVVGLFLVCAWMLRRGGPRPGGALPADAFSVLGRAPLTPQTIAHLLRVGNKLVLVAMTPGGAQPLTEVTDPMEVDRLTGLCASGRGHGPSAEFQQVLSQLSREPARGFLGAEAAGGRRR